MKTTKWETAPISCTCEVLVQLGPFKECGKPTVAAYPAMDVGWMALCNGHARKHKEAMLTDELIRRGEKWG